MEADVNDHANQTSPGILVVFDIDDTLLESTGFFAGDTWYNWQRGRSIKHENGSSMTIADADRLSCLFGKLGAFYEFGRYKPTETDAAAIVSRLQSRYAVMALTSRAPGYRSGTERELKRANMDFSKSHLLTVPNALVYDLNDGSSTRSVSYVNGIVMSTGLDKGIVLKDLLGRIKKSYDAIFFIDDGVHNVNDMDDAWKGEKTYVGIYHYTGVDKTISDSDIQQSRNANVALDTFLQIAFPDRYSDFSADMCE